MSDQKHTPGPWGVYEDPLDLSIRDERRLCIALATGGLDDPIADGINGPTTVANAHLIAAAPELLAACQALMETHHGYHLGAGPCICRAHEAARLAIAKAEGR